MIIIPIQEINLEEIITGLNSDGTIVYPTETCYGLGCDAFNEVAVEKIFNIKERDPGKPALMLVHDVSIIKQYIDWMPAMEKLAEKFWPGALTLVASLKDSKHPFARGVIGTDNTIAFRVTSHPLAREMCGKLGRPLVSTSANIAAMGNPYDIENILGMFRHHDPQPDILIDAGVLPEQKPSTIVKVEGEALTVLRQGEIFVE